MSNYKTMSSYDAYYKNIRDMANSHTNYYMANTDLGNGQALPEYQKQERIPTKVKKKIVKPGDKIACVYSKGVPANIANNTIYGRLLSTE
jgi:hypothetical protein